MEEELTPEILEDMEDLQEDELEDQQENQFQNSQENQEIYGYPEPDEKHNQHAFISKTVFESPEVEKISYLMESELGKPLFNIRFLLDMEDITKHYIDPLLKELGIPKESNRIANYFRNKIYNICSSGLSREGFIQNMNVTRRMDTTKTRIRNPIQNLKGGERKRK